MDKDRIKTYMDLKLKEKSIQEEISVLSKEIVEEMKENKTDKIKSEVGTLSLSERKVWEYTDNVEKAVLGVKKLQAEEKATGEANFTTMPQLKFFKPKAPKIEETS